MNILTVAEMQEIMSRFTYRIGWKFRVYQGETRGAMLEILATVDDSVKLGDFAKLEIYAAIPPYETERGFLKWLFSRLREAEVHECGEFFKLDGVCVWNPHRAFADRDILDL
jgi:hypothetical protein